MILGIVELTLDIPGASSLKDKRQVIRSLMDRIRHDFHVSISEVGDQELWNRATLGIACVTNDAGHAESVLGKVRNVFDRDPDAEIIDWLQSIEHR
ncbi:MAG: DUF503 domain-containing protein [Chlorobia bacterium]|nr:DUF503 domain-containing protein [Fimbriimonadaceae bacterium]